MFSKASEKQEKESSKMHAQIALRNSPYRPNGSHRSLCSHGTLRYIFRTGKRKFLKKNPRHFWKLNHSISNNRKPQAAIRSMERRPKINAANTEKNQDLSISSLLSFSSAAKLQRQAISSFPLSTQCERGV
jgi:hypothetical protein